MRLITVWNTSSPNRSTTRVSTSRECSVRESYMVASRPSMASLGLIRRETLSMVSVSSATPRMAKYSHSSGTMMPSEQASAFTVSRPRDGWQSMRMTS